MTGPTTDWVCPNCGFGNTHELMEDKVCERCGYSDELPEDTNAGYQ